MKKRYKRIFCVIGLISIILYTACKKEYLEVNPIGNLSQQTLATKVGINGLLVGAYAMLDGVSGVFYWGNNTNWCFSNVASHEAVRGSTSTPDVGSFENCKVYPIHASVLKKWQGCYSGIQRANEVLRLLPLIPSNALTTDEALQIKAEAIFVRAVLHFELVKTWLNVPYVDESVYFNAGNYNIPNTTLIWPKIEADFQFAAGNLSATKLDAGRANSWAAKTFLAKVYIHQQKYSQALPLLTDCIDNGVTAKGKKYDLVGYFDNFDTKKENSAESVFAIQFSVNDGSLGANGNQGFVMPQPKVPATAGGGSSAVTFDCVNVFKTDPVTGLPLFDTYNNFNIKNDMGLSASAPFTPYAGPLDSRLDHTVGRRDIPILDWGLFNVSMVSNQSDRGPYMMKKFFFFKADLGKTTESLDAFTTISSGNYDMIRFADVLLLAAECEVEVGSLAKAETYVNRVRTRAANPAGWVKTYIDNSDPSKGFTNIPAANYFVGLYTGQFNAQGKAYASKAVRFERRLELALEGHRFFDLQRWDNGTGSMATEINAILAFENAQVAKYPNLKGVVFVKGKNEIYPIPQTEIDLSMVNGKTVLVQNPGYN